MTLITYNIREGTYVRIGNLVFINVSIFLTSKGTDTGNATITGFPFTAALTRNAVAIGEWNDITFATDHFQAGAIFAGATSTISLQQSGDAAAFTNLTDASFADSSRLFFSMTVNI